MKARCHGARQELALRPDVPEFARNAAVTAKPVKISGVVLTTVSTRLKGVLRN
jgi:hypothetical protein